MEPPVAVETLQAWLQEQWRALAGAARGGRPMDPAVYAAVKRESDYYVLDPVAGYVHKPFASRRYEWPEHPRGHIVAKTNNLGFRNDARTRKRKAKGVRRILVTGDSHTDGMVFNAESFSSVLEDRLNRGSAAGHAEVLNGGTGYYGPHNYLWFLEKYRLLRPDLFVVGFYAGNDFVDAARLIEWTERSAHPARYLAKLRQALKSNEGPIWQALNQVLYFKENPGMMERSLEFTRSQFLAMRRLCEEDGIGLFVVLLPAKIDVEWDSDAPRMEALKSFLGLSPGDLGLNEDLRERLGRWLRAESIPFWDAAPDMRESGQALFWNADHHLNHLGHRLVGERLAEKEPFRGPAR